MTSIASESVANILCTSMQTRFHVDHANYRELDIPGLNIVVTSGDSGATSGAKSVSKLKAKKAKGAEGLEILTNAHLKLKEGRRYALVGRNGTGKSTLLRAITEKLIPGLSEDSRVALLQQTRLTDDDNDNDDPAKSGETGSTLQEVIERATSKNIVEQEIKLLSDGVESSNPYAPLRALRKFKHERMQRKHFLLDKDARLRSGDRGLAARKTLVAFEKDIAEFEGTVEQAEEEISPETLQSEIQEAADMLADLELQIEPTKLTEIEARAKKILLGLGFTEESMLKPLSSLSGGWHMRASLAVALLQEVDILILDEPTNFLDLLGIIWLQKHLEALDDADKPPTLIIVSHDRDFTQLCTDLIIIKDKQLTYFHGDLPTFESSQSERRSWLIKMKEAQDKQRTHMEKTIAQNMKAGKANDDQNKIRQAKSRQKKLDDRTGMMKNARGGKLRLNDQVGFFLKARQDIEIPPEERPVFIYLPQPWDMRHPGSLLSLENASFRYSPKAPFTIQNVNLTVHMGDRIGILGLNGSGKSTLIKLLVQESRPSTGTATTNSEAKVGYYSQHAVEGVKEIGKNDPALTALGLLMSEHRDEANEGEIRGHLAKFGLPGRFASDVPIAKLSGGQLVRVQLARLCWNPHHCLVLDEVTTHLDYETVIAFREALSHWRGAVVLVSHDRWFMRGVIEGGEDDDDDGDIDSDDEDDNKPRGKRVVYRIKNGELVELKGGVDEFERLMERRVTKLESAP